MALLELVKGMRVTSHHKTAHLTFSLKATDTHQEVIDHCMKQVLVCTGVQPPSQQATRHARRVYVGGLPPTANEQNIATFFSNALAAVGGTTAGPGKPNCLLSFMHNSLPLDRLLAVWLQNSGHNLLKVSQVAVEGTCTTFLNHVKRGKSCPGSVEAVTITSG